MPDPQTFRLRAIPPPANVPAASSAARRDERLAVLKGAGLPGAEPPPLDHLARLVRQILGTPLALVSFINDGRHIVEGQQGLPEPFVSSREIPISHSFCQHVVATGAPLVVDDAPHHPLVCDNPAIRDLGVVAYCGVPVRAPGGHVVGSLCAVDGQPRAWADRDEALLRDLARLVETEVALQAELAERADSEVRYRALFEGSPDAILLLDPDTEEVLDANAAACTLYGAPYRDLVGQSVKTFSMDVARGQAVIRRLLCEEGSVEFDSVQRRQDGTPFHVRIKASVVQLEGRPVLLSVNRDVTEQVEAEAALAQRTAELQAITDHSPDFIARVGRDYRYRFLNRATARRLGIQAGAAVGRSAAELGIDPSISAQQEDHFREVFETGQPLDVEYTSQVDGRRVFVQSRIVPEADAAGRFDTVLLVARDVTAWREAEAAYRSTRAQADRLAAVVAKATNGVVITDADGRVEWGNEGFTRITGYTLEEMRGRKPGHMLQGPETDPETVAFFRERMAGREPFSAELLNYRKDGTTYWIRIDVTPLVEEDGQLSGFMAIETDVTERKRAEDALRESEARYRSVVETVRDVVFQTDLEGRWTFLNPAWETVMGYTIEESLGRPVPSFVHPEDRGRTIKDMGELTRREVPFIRDEMRYMTRSEEIRHVEIHVQLRYDDTGHVVGTSGTLTDITNTVRFEAEREARERSEEMLRLKSSFLNNMSHELRTPLTGILGFAGILGEEVSPDLLEFVEPILRGGERLMTTLNSVLDLAQLESGTLRIEAAPVDVLAEARDVLTVVRPLAASKGLALRLVGDTAWALADRPALGRILVNLVGNAIKFTEVGGVTVRVTADTETVRLDVSDTGVGIGTEFLPHLFGEFTQASDGLARTHEGNGLGLAITRRLVEIQNGRISVQSTMGEGSTFTVELPAADAEARPQ